MFVLGWYDPEFSRVHTRSHRCDVLKIDVFSAPTPRCIVDSHVLECSCIPFFCKFSRPQKSKHQIAQTQLGHNLWSPQVVMENCKCFSSALISFLILPFCFVKVYKCPSLVFLHSLVNRPIDLIAQTFRFCFPSSVTSPVSRPSRIRRPGRSIPFEDFRLYLGHRINLMRARLFPRLPHSFVVPSQFM